MVKRACKDWIRNKYSADTKLTYTRCQKHFDQLVRKKKRAFTKGRFTDETEMKPSHVMEGYKKPIGMSNLKSKSPIPFEVKKENGNVM